MQNKSFITLLIFFSFFINSCKKKNNIYLAKNYYEQSLVEAEEKNTLRALQLVNKSIETSPTPQALALKATLFYQNNEFSESLEIYKKLLQDKETPNALKCDVTNNLACSHLALGQKDEAKKLWFSLTSNPNYLSPELAWFNIGLLEFSNASSMNLSDDKIKESIKNAQKYFSKAISIANEYVDAYYYLALTYMYLKEFVKAKDVIISLLTISPDHDPAKELLELSNKALHEQLSEKNNSAGG